MVESALKYSLRFHLLCPYFEILMGKTFCHLTLCGVLALSGTVFCGVLGEIACN